MYFRNFNVPALEHFLNTLQGTGDFDDAYRELQEDENGRKRKSIEKFYRDGD